jgi:hypothetical protein
MHADFEKELLGLEVQFWKSMQDRDIDAALRLTDETCIVTGAQGVAQIDKTTLAQMMESGAWTLHDFTIQDVKVQRLNDEVAIIGYKVHERLDAVDASTWVRKDGRWVCALHTESVAGDAYGRDRSPSAATRVRSPS